MQSDGFVMVSWYRIGFPDEKPFGAELYNRLNTITGIRHDPCVLDVFMSIIDNMSGSDAQPWWAYNKKRKQLLLEKGVKPQ